jgi:N-acyl-D-amino-acid deacylase
VSQHTSSGQDGLSFAPASRSTIAFVSRYFGVVNDICPSELENACRVADLLEYFDGSTALNVPYLAPHGTICAQVPASTRTDVPKIR